MITLFIFFLCKYSFNGKPTLIFKAWRGQDSTHFKHLMHLRFVVPDFIAPKKQHSAQRLHPLQSALFCIESPSRLLSFGKISAKGFLNNFGSCIYEGSLIFSTMGFNLSKSQKTSSLSMYGCFVGIYAPATMFF